VFVNALFSNQSGYNSLPSREKKIRTFDRVLTSLESRYRPDLILIACNTLSVIYDDTEFAATTQTPVRDIVKPGVALIESALRKRPDALAFIFATRTTVKEDSHRAALARRGLDTSHIVTQACPELAVTIERGFDSEDTEILIATYVDEALAKAGRHSGPIVASLNCTHYGYAESLWRAAFAEYGVGPVWILNPNRKLAELPFAQAGSGRFERTETKVSVVSKVQISEEKISSIGRALQPVSKRAAEALRAYQWLPDLFPVP
jgi:aspartate/glutamate racemase